MLRRYLHDLLLFEAVVLIVIIIIGLNQSLKDLVTYALVLTAWSMFMACVTLIGGRSDTR